MLKSTAAVVHIKKQIIMSISTANTYYPFKLSIKSYVITLSFGC